MNKKNRTLGSDKFAKGIKNAFENTVGTAIRKSPKARSVKFRSPPELIKTPSFKSVPMLKVR